MEALLPLYIYVHANNMTKPFLTILSTIANSLVGSQMRTRFIVVRANQIVILSLQQQHQAAKQLLVELFAHVGLQCGIRTIFDEAPDFAKIVRETHEQGLITLPDIYLNLYQVVLYPSVIVPRPHKASVDPLTHKEHEVLALIQKGLSNKEICQQLSISLSTAKWHIKKISLANYKSPIALLLFRVLCIKKCLTNKIHATLVFSEKLGLTHFTEMLVLSWFHNTRVFIC